MGKTLDDICSETLDKMIVDNKLQNKRIGEVVIGSVATHGDQHGIARDVVQTSSLHPDTPGFTLQKGCISSLEGVSIIANKIALGQIDSGIALGAELISD